ncbi:hypothetical protein DVH24_010016, partial [Malus domestica]
DCTITVAEVLALRDVLKLANQKKGGVVSLGEFETCCRYSLVGVLLFFMTWKHIYREANFVVDTMTNVGLSLSNMYNGIVPFLRILPAPSFDCNNTGFN